MTIFPLGGVRGLTVSPPVAMRRN